MPLAKDLITVGEDPEEALRVGDSGPLLIAAATVSTQTGATNIGGYSGATLIECNPTAVGSNAVVFMGTTEQDKEYTIYNTSTTASVASTSVAAGISADILNVYPPSGGNFQGLGNNISFTIPINKAAYVTRLGPIPPVSTSTLTIGTIASDRWIYFLSN